MKNILIALFATVMALSACQKEPSFEDPNGLPGGGNASLGLLVRSVEATPSVCNVTVFG